MFDTSSGRPTVFENISSIPWAHVLVSLVDFEMTAAAAVASTRVHCEPGPRILTEDTFFPLTPPVRAALTAAGYRVRPDLYGGRVCLVDVDGCSGRARGASDPRGGGALAEV